MKGTAMEKCLGGSDIREETGTDLPGEVCKTESFIWAWKVEQLCWNWDCVKYLAPKLKC